MISVAKKGLSEMKKKVESDQEDLASILARIQALESKLEEYDVGEIKSQLKNLSAELSLLSDYIKKGSKIKEYDEKIKDIYSSLGQQKVDIDTLKSTLESLKDEVVNWKAKLEELSDQITRVDDEVNQLAVKVNSIDVLEADIHALSQSLSDVLDKLLELKSRMIAIEKTQEEIIQWEKTVAEAMAKSKLERVEPGKVEDEDISKIRSKIREIGKAIPEKVAKQKSVIQPAKRLKPKKETKEYPGMPIIEEITIGAETKKSDFEDKIDNLLQELQSADPRKWDPIKEELTKLLTDELNKIRAELSKKKPANEKVLNLMITKAELGVVSLSAAFETKDYKRIETIVRKTLETIRDVRDQLG